MLATMVESRRLQNIASGHEQCVGLYQLKCYPTLIVGTLEML